MPTESFEKLASQLAERDRALADSLADAREAAERLCALARDSIHAFIRTAREQGAEHLAQIEVSPVTPDEKHVDCVQFTVRRGRWEIVCVAKASAKVTLVGPFKRGRPEKPCSDQALRGPEVEEALQRLLLRLIEQASEL